MSTVIGTFSSREAAEKAAQELRDQGFTEDEISLVAKGDQKAESADGVMDMETAADGAAWGGIAGGAAGLLAAVGAITIPGIGPIVAAGPLAAALTGAAGGGLAGGLLDMGIPEDRGQFYEDEVKRGRVLATVDTEADMAEKAAEIMRRNGASDVEVH